MSTKIRKIVLSGSWGISVIFTRSHKIASFEIGRLTLVQILQEVDCVARILLCNWGCEAVCSGEVDLLLTYITDAVT